MSEAHLGKVVDGRYRLDRLLGEGAAGAVYAATQLSVERTVAVKLLHSANADRFGAEARAIAKLNHTNVITLHDFGFDTDLNAHFMVTEFAEGVPLSERMSEVMGTDLILRISLEIASALNHAHANGVLHRDLKPENVILTRADGRVDVAKVLDFGLAHLMDEEAPENEDPTIAIQFDPEEEVRTNEVGRPVPDTDDFDREDEPSESEEDEPTIEARPVVEPPPAVEESAFDEEQEVLETAPMPATTLDDLDTEEPTLEPNSRQMTPAEISAEIDLRKNLFENIPSEVKKGSSMIVSAAELETTVLPSLDLSADSAFEEEE